MMRVNDEVTSDGVLGQGAQWPEMGKTLMKEFPTYLKTIRALDAYLDKFKDGRTWTIEGNDNILQ